jgi:hypothetical protein
MRDYVDNRWSGVPIGPDDFVTVPTAVANFANRSSTSTTTFRHRASDRTGCWHGTAEHACLSLAGVRRRQAHQGLPLGHLPRETTPRYRPRNR